MCVSVCVCVRACYVVFYLFYHWRSCLSHRCNRQNFLNFTVISWQFIRQWLILDLLKRLQTFWRGVFWGGGELDGYPIPVTGGRVRSPVLGNAGGEYLSLVTGPVGGEGVLQSRTGVPQPVTLPLKITRMVVRHGQYASCVHGRLSCSHVYYRKIQKVKYQRMSCFFHRIIIASQNTRGYGAIVPPVHILWYQKSMRFKQET